MKNVLCVLALTLVFGLGEVFAQTRQKVDLIMNGEFVVTLDDVRPVIEDGAVAIHDGRIVAVGSAGKIQAAYHAPMNIRGKARVLMPGLVNGHTHAAMVLFRGLADDLALVEWLFDFIFPAEDSL
jgi:5-methylthioadenosine/S-adenosylhomocysteine deaminase